MAAGEGEAVPGPHDLHEGLRGAVPLHQLVDRQLGQPNGQGQQDEARLEALAAPEEGQQGQQPHAPDDQGTTDQLGSSDRRLPAWEVRALQDARPPQTIPFILPAAKATLSDIVTPLNVLLLEAPLWAWGDPEGPPRAPGAYAWFADHAPAQVPAADLLVRQGRRLLAVGIAPRAAGGPGRDRLRASLRPRIGYDFAGRADASALRLALGVVLQGTLALRLEFSPAQDRFDWGEDGEAALSDWMQLHLRVSWLEHSRPWEVTDMAFRAQTLPLNPQAQDPSPFQRDLLARQAALRDEARARAAAG